MIRFTSPAGNSYVIRPDKEQEFKKAHKVNKKWKRTNLKPVPVVREDSE